MRAQTLPRASLYLTLAAALIALGAGVKQVFFANTPGNAQSGLDQFATTINPMPEQSRLEPDTRLSPQSDQRVPNEQRRDDALEAPPAETHTNSGDTARTAQAPRQHEVTGQTARQSRDAKLEDPTAVIGRVFPVSDSVEAGCRLLGGSCDEKLDGLLSHFAQEARDPAWASQVEATLRNYIAKAEPDKYSIRAIECRTTVCLVELASPYGPYLGAPYAFVRANNLFNGSVVFGYESNQYLGRVTVTLRAFERR